MTRSSLVRTRFLSASCRERSRENGDVHAAEGKEREKGELAKRDSVPQSPRWKSRSHPASSGDELDGQEEAAGPRAGTGLWVHQFGNWVLGQVLRKEEEEDDQEPI